MKAAAGASPIPPPASAAARAYDWTKEEILSGRMPGGELLSEGEIGAAIGVSRTPVREALLRLEGEGLVRLYPKRGALVVPVSAREIAEVLEIREMIEGFAVQQLCARTSDLAGTRGALEAQQEFLQSARLAELVEADRRFHTALVAEIGNGLLLRVYDGLRDRQRRMGQLTVGVDHQRAGAVVAEHAELLQAVSQGDRVRALGVLAAHLAGTGHALRERAGRENVPA